MGCSRNDQVATDVRLWLRSELTTLEAHLRSLIAVAAHRAEAEVDAIMPGYTHLQPAQPVRFGHWLLSHAWAWQRDALRLADLRTRVDYLPLGSGAIAGHAFGLDRAALAAALGCTSGPTQNSMDSVSDRDFIVETLSWASLLGVHLSRWAEDVIIYSSAEFGLMTLSDAYSTGSSLMPQKKNPGEGVAAGRGRGVWSVVGRAMPCRHTAPADPANPPLLLRCLPAWPRCCPCCRRAGAAARQVWAPDWQPEHAAGGPEGHAQHVQ